MGSAAMNHFDDDQRILFSEFPYRLSRWTFLHVLLAIVPILLFAVALNVVTTVTIPEDKFPTVAALSRDAMLAQDQNLATDFFIVETNRVPNRQDFHILPMPSAQPIDWQTLLSAHELWPVAGRQTLHSTIRIRDISERYAGLIHTKALELHVTGYSRSEEARAVLMDKEGIQLHSNTHYGLSPDLYGTSVRRVPNIALQSDSDVLLVGTNEAPLYIEPGEVQSLEFVVTCMDPGLYSFSVRVPASFMGTRNYLELVDECFLHCPPVFALLDPIVSASGLAYNAVNHRELVDGEYRIRKDSTP